MYKALSLIPSTANQKKKKKKFTWSLCPRAKHKHLSTTTFPPSTFYHERILTENYEYNKAFFLNE
jgi:hypothetical protein